MIIFHILLKNNLLVTTPKAGWPPWAGVPSGLGQAAFPTPWAGTLTPSPPPRLCPGKPLQVCW